MRCIVDFKKELSTKLSPSRDIWMVALRIYYSVFNPKAVGFVGLDLLQELFD